MLFCGSASFWCRSGSGFDFTLWCRSRSGSGSYLKFTQVGKSKEIFLLMFTAVPVYFVFADPILGTCTPLERALPIKMTQGALALAALKRSLTRLAPWPTSTPIERVLPIKMTQGALALAALKRSLTRLAPWPTSTPFVRALPIKMTQGALALAALKRSLTRLAPWPTSPLTERVLPIKMTQGALALAALKRSLTRLAPWPTSTSSNSEPEAWKNGTPAWPATALQNDQEKRSKRGQYKKNNKREAFNLCYQLCLGRDIDHFLI